MRRVLLCGFAGVLALVGLSGCAAYVEPEPVVYYRPYYPDYYYAPNVVVVHGGYYGGGYYGRGYGGGGYRRYR